MKTKEPFRDAMTHILFWDRMESGQEFQVGIPQSQLSQANAYQFQSLSSSGTTTCPAT